MPSRRAPVRLGLLCSRSAVVLAQERRLALVLMGGFQDEGLGHPHIYIYAWVLVIPSLKRNDQNADICPRLESLETGHMDKGLVARPGVR